MLPAVAPHARILRYGYQSGWFGKEAMQQNASIVADRLLRALRRKREVPAYFNSHSQLADVVRMFRSVRCSLWRTASAGWSC